MGYVVRMNPLLESGSVKSDVHDYALTTKKKGWKNCASLRT